MKASEVNQVPVNSLYSTLWVKKTIPIPLTGLTTYIKSCKSEEFLTYLKLCSVIVQSVEYEEFAIQLLLSHHHQAMSDDEIIGIVNQYIRPQVLSFQLVALPDSILVLPFYELLKQLHEWSENHYTLYYSIPLNVTFYCGPKDYVNTALTVLNEISKGVSHSDVKSIISDKSYQEEYIFGFDNVSEPNSTLHDNRSVLSAAEFISANATSIKKFASDITIPPFSLTEDVYTPKHTIFCNGKLSYIYSDVFNTFSICNKLSVGAGSELADYFVVFLGDLLRSHLAPQYGVLKGFYYNRNGWYACIQDSNRETAGEVQALFANLIKNTRFTHREKIPLRLTEHEFIKLLVYVSEVAQQNATIHQINEREIMLLANYPWFTVIKDALKALYQAVSIPIETRSLFNSLDCLLKPSCKINDLQPYWSSNFSARGLDTNPIGFACYMARCKRQVLFNYLRSSLSITDKNGILNILHCFEGFFIVFMKDLAPSRDRWKKYRNKIIPQSFDIRYAFYPIKPTQSNVVPEELRNQIESLSNGNVTMHWEERQLYIVGDQTSVDSFIQEHAELVELQSSKESFVFWHQFTSAVFRTLSNRVHF